jgi:hypothetical protein
MIGLQHQRNPPKAYPHKHGLPVITRYHLAGFLVLFLALIYLYSWLLASPHKSVEIHPNIRVKGPEFYQDDRPILTLSSKHLMNSAPNYSTEMHECASVAIPEKRQKDTLLCEEGQTCCGEGPAKMGCCAQGQGVCCGRGKWCCNTGSTCSRKEQGKCLTQNEREYLGTLPQEADRVILPMKNDS